MRRSSVGKGLFSRYWLAAALATTLVFTHLVLHHHHYYLMFAPAAALLCALAVSRLEERVGFGSTRRQALFVGAATAMLLVSTLQGLMWMNVILDVDPYPRRMAELIGRHTAQDDKILIEGGGWGGHELFLAGRKGLSIWDTRFLEDPKNLARIKSLGYTKLVMMSETPLLVAVRMTKPGQTGWTRDKYEDHLTAVAKDWPTLFQTEDILIKEIPK